MNNSTEKFEITLDGVTYESAPETLDCNGCYFSTKEADEHDLCFRSLSYVDCGNQPKIIWIKKEQVQLSQTEYLADSTEESEDLIKEDIRSYNVGNSNYANHKIQPWDIWLEYKLNPWDADIVKRVLRHKEGDSRELDYEKIIHICQERIRQLKLGLE